MIYVKYNFGTKEDKNWLVAEECFDERYLGKCESIMCQGNGYMGIRAATEEEYVGNVRGTFVAGTFNKFTGEVTELPNVADIISMKIVVENQRLSLLTGKVKDYKRVLNLKNGLLERSFIWITCDNQRIKFCFKRFVSMYDKHLICQSVEITPLDKNTLIEIESGIDGRVSNSGSQHFTEGEKRFYDKKYLQSVMKTSYSNIDFIVNTAHDFKVNGKECFPEEQLYINRRIITLKHSFEIKKNDKLEFVKISNINTSRDIENESKTLDQLKKSTLEHLMENYKISVDDHLVKSSRKWQDDIWREKDIVVNSENEFDQLAIRFAIYHLAVMSPTHDNRMNIGAKGLSGEGYKGHTFWDTEIFMLPYFIFSDPDGAKSLCTYRYKNLSGARRKAKENGFEGAMFPWESAWIEDGEVTPLWGEANVVTGEAQKIWTGLIEQHITSDVSYGIYNYYTCTGDEKFMDDCGYEVILDTAKFWESRLEYNNTLDRYEINGIIGPDEYKEHVNNNAYTNYMAHWNIKLAMKYANMLKNIKPVLYNKIDKIIDIENTFPKWQEKLDKIFLPKPNENNIIPQDDKYLFYPTIALEKYKKSDKIGTISKDFSVDQISKMQVSKQADVLVLFLIMEDLFEKEIKKDNFYYYEDKCLHDSSLSLSTHSILANDLGENEKAYELFERACRIDLGPVMTTSDIGVHAASFGGIWQCIVYGFMGVRVVNGELRIQPNLPQKWKSVVCNIFWQGSELRITITKETILIENISDDEIVKIKYNEEEIIIQRKKEIKLWANDN